MLCSFRGNVWQVCLLCPVLLDTGERRHLTSRRHLPPQTDKVRFYYCSIINLLCSLIIDDEYDVSTRQLQTLFTCWCHVWCLRFWRDNLVVDVRQMISLSLFMVVALCLMYMASFTFLLCQLDSQVSTLVFFMTLSGGLLQ